MLHQLMLFVDFFGQIPVPGTDEINEELKTNNKMPSSVARGSEAPSPSLAVKGVVIDDGFLQQECYNASGGAVEALPVEEKPKDEELIPLDELKKRLRDHLDEVTKTPNSFGFHEVLKDPPNPGLTIEGFGKISFPLSEYVVQRIVEASLQVDASTENG